MRFIKKYKNYLILHSIILLWGFTGIIGKVLTLPATAIVGYRMFIAFIGIGAYIVYRKFSFKVSRKAFYKIFGTGLIIAGHWFFFFEAIKVSKVSIALACLSTASFFTAFVEPLFFRRKIIVHEILLGLLVIAGLFMIFEFEPEYTLGIVFAVIAAFLASLFSVINGVLIKTERSTVISFYEMLAGTIGITCLYAFTERFNYQMLTMSATDLFLLLLLGLVCTAMAFVATVEIMKELSPYTLNISINLEPVYAIVLALLFFGEGEQMSLGFYLGAVLILFTVIANSWLKRRIKEKKKN